MDYGKTDPSIGWRFSDAWLSMAGAGDPSIPNGVPVDDWGIRVEGCHPVGASVSRGGALNSPAAVYAVSKYVNWLEKYAPPEAKNMTFSEAGSVPAQGQIAQQIFWYTAFTSDFTKQDLPVTGDDGSPKWRMAPSPRGPYWQEGMKLGYQDAGAWTFLTSTPLERRKASWLYAQFVVSKTVSLKKFLVGLTPVRQSDLESEYLTEVAPNYGGLIEFYRSQAKYFWTPTGTNVPNYPELSDLWWRHLSPAASGEITPKQALDNLAQAMDTALASSTSNLNRCETRLNASEPEAYWLTQPGAPKAKLDNEDPPGKTWSYEEALKYWQTLGEQSQ
jgi:glycerol transport system substrate-binding protein